MAGPRIITATIAQKEAYRGVYPLYAYITLGDVQLPIEDLRCWPKEDPQFEVMAPTGQHFGNGENTHSLLCNNITDIYVRVRQSTLVPCTDRCTV